MEGESDVTDLPFLLQFKGRFIGSAFPEMIEISRSLCVHQIEIEIIHTAGLKLTLEKRPDVLLLLKISGRQLIRQNITISGIAAGETLLQCQLALSLNISVGGVKIIESCLQKGIHHLLRLLQVHVLSHHRKTHASKPEVLLNPFHFFPSSPNPGKVLPPQIPEK